MMSAIPSPMVTVMSVMMTSVMVMAAHHPRPRHHSGPGHETAVMSATAIRRWAVGDRAHWRRVVLLVTGRREAETHFGIFKVEGWDVVPAARI